MRDEDFDDSTTAAPTLLRYAARERHRAPSYYLHTGFADEFRADVLFGCIAIFLYDAARYISYYGEIRFRFLVCFILKTSLDFLYRDKRFLAYSGFTSAIYACSRWAGA